MDSIAYQVIRAATTYTRGTDGADRRGRTTDHGGTNLDRNAETLGTDGHGFAFSDPRPDGPDPHSNPGVSDESPD